MAFHGFFWLRYQLRVGIYMLHTFIREMVIQKFPYNSLGGGRNGLAFHISA